MDNPVNDERTIIGTLLVLAAFNILKIQDKVTELIQALSVFISPSDFTNSFYADVFALFLGDMEIGLVPDSNAILGQLSMDNMLPDNAEEQIKEALSRMSIDHEEVLNIAKRMRNARELKEL